MKTPSITDHNLNGEPYNDSKSHNLYLGFEFSSKFEYVRNLNVLLSVFQKLSFTLLVLFTMLFMYAVTSRFIGAMSTANQIMTIRATICI